MFCSYFIGDKHLSTSIPSPTIHSFLSGEFPYQFWVSRLRGLPRSTLFISKKHRHYGTFIPNRVLPKWFRPFRCRSQKCDYRLFFPYTQSLQASQPVRAWTFLYIMKNAAFVKILFFSSINNFF